MLRIDAPAFVSSTTNADKHVEEIARLVDAGTLRTTLGEISVRSTLPTCAAPMR